MAKADTPKPRDWSTRFHMTVAFDFVKDPVSHTFMMMCALGEGADLVREAIRYYVEATNHPAGCSDAQEAMAVKGYASMVASVVKEHKASGSKARASSSVESIASFPLRTSAPEKTVTPEPPLPSNVILVAEPALEEPATHDPGHVATIEPINVPSQVTQPNDVGSPGISSDPPDDVLPDATAKEDQTLSAVSSPESKSPAVDRPVTTPAPSEADTPLTGQSVTTEPVSPSASSGSAPTLSKFAQLMLNKSPAKVVIVGAS
jgi:hypothetical protein